MLSVDIFLVLFKMASSINFLSLNIGMSSSLAGLTSLIPAYDLDVIFLQVVRLTREQINHFLDGLGFQAEVNTDHEHPSTPGTAIAWKKTLRPSSKILNYEWLKKLQFLIQME